MLLPLTLDTAKCNTPDTLTALFNLIAIIFLVSKGKKYFSIPFFCLLVLTRPESIIFIVAFCVIYVLFKPNNYNKVFISLLFLSSTLCYLLSSLLFSEYSWALLYKHSCTGFIPDLAAANQSISLREYLLGLRVFVNSIFYSEYFLIVFLLIYPLLHHKKENKIAFVVIYALLFSIIARAFLLPDVATRYFEGTFLASLILFFKPFHSGKEDI